MNPSSSPLSCPLRHFFTRLFFFSFSSFRVSLRFVSSSSRFTYRRKVSLGIGKLQQANIHLLPNPLPSQMPGNAEEKDHAIHNHSLSVSFRSPNTRVDLLCVCVWAPYFALMYSRMMSETLRCGAPL